MTRDVLSLAHKLTQRGEPFVLATVVWRRSPSSGKTGSKAIIRRDGAIHGWLGGACAEPAVVRQATALLRSGEPRLLFLGPPEELEARGRDDVIALPIACQSEGAMEVYLEPVVPAPHLVVVGRSPAVDALASMARTLGWSSVVVDEGGDPEEHVGNVPVVIELDAEAAELDRRSLVVVATQGHYDETALEWALGARAAYVGLVASRRRAEAVLGYLRDRGVPEASLARVRAPAGEDLGSVAHEEIAVGILAEFVRLRATGALGLTVQASDRDEATDPVCGMRVTISRVRHHTAHRDHTYWFCSAHCLAAFEESPARYATTEA